MMELTGNISGRYRTQYSYDCMGNITSLKRNGLLDNGSYGLIDDLTLSYDGNQLMVVSDDGDDPTYNNVWNFMDGADDAIEYEYDANGNVTKDLNRNILSIQYNSLNLPTMINFTGGKTIKYTYSADGRKLRAAYTTVTPVTSKTVDYCGNLIFENGQLKQVLVDGGYIPMDDWSGTYRFYVKDHLGNNRMVVHQSGTIEQVNNYYPYGGLMANTTGWNAQRFKYNGKEFDRMHGLDWYDFGARWMDACIGRWHSVDPLCEKYYNLSPYVYCAGNPISFVDPDGMEKIIALNPNEANNKNILTVARGFRDNSKIINIWAHGDSNGIYVYNNSKKEETKITTAVDMKNFLLKNSDIYRNREKDEHITMVLHSCMTGSVDTNGDGFAKKMSKEMKGITVIAPDDNVSIVKKGNEYSTFVGTTNKINGQSKILSTGKWHEYENGKDIRQYDSNEKPGSNNWLMDIYQFINEFINDLTNNIQR